MVTTEQKKFVKENLRYGDVAKVAVELSVPYITVHDILKREGSDHRIDVWEAAEKLIVFRIEQEKKAKKKYSRFSQ